MFTKDLETKLKNIFGSQKVVFDSFQLGKEQETLFVEIDSAKDYTTDGNMGMLVVGRLGISGPAGKFKYGWAHKKIEIANRSDTDSFIFGRNELPIKFVHNSNEFIKYEVDFVYRFHASFNPRADKIESAEIKIQEE